MKNKKVFLVSVIAIILSILYTVIINGMTGGAVTESNVITVESASCNWKETYFEVCEYINWAQAPGYYAKGYIAGGNPLDKSPAIYSAPATYCQDVGNLEGKRAVHAYLYGPGGTIKALDTNNVVNCNFQKITERNVKQKLQFQAKGDFRNRPDATGDIILTGFGGKPKACIITGTWKTNNDALQKTRDYCHGATGNFKGYADHGKQYIVNDPHPFSWQGISGLIIDPEEQIYHGYLLYAPTCDRLSYNKQRYYARARVVDFNDDGITINWEYFNDDTKPAVDFDAEVECQIIDDAVETAFEDETPVVVEPEEQEEEKTQEEIEIPEQMPQQQENEKPKGLFYRLASWIRTLFK